MKLCTFPCQGNYEFLLNRENGLWLIKRKGEVVPLDIIRERRGHEFGGLDIVVLNTTNRCNLSCRYCQVGERKEEKKDFEWKYGKILLNKCLDLNQNVVVIVFHGSEPLMNFEFIEEFTKYAKKIFSKTDKKVIFSLQTNATKLDERVVKFLNEENVGVSFSLDGFKRHNDATRIYLDGSSSYEDVINGIKLLKKYQKQTFPITVVTKHNVDDLVEIVNMVRKEGFPYIQLTPLEPLGNGSNKDLLPDVEKLADNMIKIYEENFKWALLGDKFRVRNLVNILATFFVETIPNVCSICGINKLQVLGIDINGDIYPCDMWFGRKEYSVGNIENISIDEALQSPKNFRNSRKVELIKGKDDYPFIRLHTGGCPANSHGFYGDIYHLSCYTPAHEKLYEHLAGRMPFLIKSKLIEFFLRR